MNISPVTLEGAHVRLEPLSLSHLPHLCEVGLDPALWTWGMQPLQTQADLQSYLELAVRSQEQGKALPFAILEKRSGKAIGSTRYENIDHANRHLEIGWTWVARRWQRTAVNTESKLLLLTHAFEMLGCIRVEFKTHSHNMQSRNALLRIGAKEEGTFRNHMIGPGGTIRHSVYFSIIDAEWSEVKMPLLERLRKHLC